MDFFSPPLLESLTKESAGFELFVTTNGTPEHAAKIRLLFPQRMGSFLPGSTTNLHGPLPSTKPMAMRTLRSQACPHDPGRVCGREDDRTDRRNPLVDRHR